MLLPSILDLIQRNAAKLAHDVIADLRADPHARSWEGRGDDHLEDRTRELYERLSEWLAEKDEARVSSFFSEVAGRAFEREIPLSQLVFALAFIKRHLWRYLTANILPETVIAMAQLEDLVLAIGRFFDTGVYHAVVEYESRLTGLDKRLL
jgi:hypothetical protein